MESRGCQRKREVIGKGKLNKLEMEMTKKWEELGVGWMGGKAIFRGEFGCFWVGADGFEELDNEWEVSNFEKFVLNFKKFSKPEFSEKRRNHFFSGNLRTFIPSQFKDNF